MSTVFGILILVAIFGVPLYTVGRITCFLTSELKSKMARRLWLAAALCVTAATVILESFGYVEKLSRSLHDLFGGFFAMSIMYVVIKAFWWLLHKITGEPMTPLLDSGHPGVPASGDSIDDLFRRDRDWVLGDKALDNGLTVGPQGAGDYLHGIRCDSDLGIDHSSSFDHRW